MDGKPDRIFGAFEDAVDGMVSFGGESPVRSSLSDFSAVPGSFLDLAFYPPDRYLFLDILRL
jgi:hypothetical protein